ncbi:efflux RND transporter periplasmic adaptor subunit [Halosquirtibacter xylanolyticus]|uniref:efflux RND transporter periplasmic adaptor subunit n=1 Tax=Halosquirtibacter xylanolyticus TaxID=3374599 RepID=UPI0037498032|nr:efflux RND transporter periplasmic adaptor subunit [Prolixibacteraceae bacterium]
MRKYSVMFYIIISLLWVACQPAEEKRGDEQAVSERQYATVDVRVEEAVHKKLTKVVEMQGCVDATERYAIYFKRNGYLLKLPCHVGEMVGKGRLLALLDTQEVYFDWKRKQVMFEEAKLTWKRMLSDQGLTEDQLDPTSVKARSIDLRSHLSLRRVEMEVARSHRDDCFLDSPITGVVAGMGVRVGDYITAGKKLAEVYNPELMCVQSSLLEEDLMKVQVGDKATARMAEGNKEYIATIISIDPMVDDKGLVAVRMALPTKTKLVQGMHVEVSYQIESDHRSVVVPMKALVKRDGKYVVFVVQEGKAVWRDVVLGGRSGSEVEVVKGVEVGDKVIVENNLLLSHGVAVHEL